VFVPDENKLAGANQFRDLNQVFRSARAVVGWQAVGMQMATLDTALEYVTEREQFGQPLMGFQLVQDNLTTTQGNLSLSQTTMVRIAELQDRRTLGTEHSAMAKAHVTRLTRETVALGREVWEETEHSPTDIWERYFAMQRLSTHMREPTTLINC